MTKETVVLNFSNIATSIPIDHGTVVLASQYENDIDSAGTRSIISIVNNNGVDHMAFVIDGAVFDPDENEHVIYHGRYNSTTKETTIAILIYDNFLKEHVILVFIANDSYIGLKHEHRLTTDIHDRTIEDIHFDTDSSLSVHYDDGKITQLIF